MSYSSSYHKAHNKNLSLNYQSSICGLITKESSKSSSKDLCELNQSTLKYMLQPCLTTFILKLVSLSNYCWLFSILSKTRQVVCKSSGSHEYFLALCWVCLLYMHTDICISLYILLFSVCSVCILKNTGSFLYTNSAKQRS